MSHRPGALLAAELYRAARQRSNRLLPLVPLAGLVAVVALTLASYGLTGTAGKSPLTLARDLSDTVTIILAMSLGAPVLLVAARIGGQDFQYGTIRLLVAGGATRLRILAAKLAAAAMVALAGALPSVALALLAVRVANPALARDAAHLPAAFWREEAIDLGVLGISLLTCAVLGTCASVVTRSLTAGLTIAMVWMPAENVLAGILAFLGSALGHRSLSDLIAYQLAPTLNHLIQALQPWRATVEMGARPLTPVSPAHVLLVTAAWDLAFLALAAAGTVLRRDIRD